MSIDQRTHQLERTPGRSCFEAAPFWAAVQDLSDQGVVDPTPELAKRLGRYLGAGEDPGDALRRSVEEVLDQAARNPL